MRSWSMPNISPPAESEYMPYYGRYIGLVPAGDIVETLATQFRETESMLRDAPESKGAYSYAPDKWTVKESLGHIIDAERIFTYRALRIARNDKTPLASFEQNDYVPESGANERTLKDLIDEFAAVRQASILLLRSLPAHAWERTGTASNAAISVRALAWIVAGHELHHNRIFRENYGL